MQDELSCAYIIFRTATFLRGVGLWPRLRPHTHTDTVAVRALHRAQAAMRINPGTIARAAMVFTTPALAAAAAATAGKNCVATAAFDRVAMGLDWRKNETRWKEAYTCGGDVVDGMGTVCWDRHPSFDSGDVAWMLFATTFVMLQTPAAGFAQGDCLV